MIRLRDNKRTRVDLSGVFKWVIWIGSVMLFIVLVRWAGLKGVVCFLAGSFLASFFMTWMLSKKSKHVAAFVELISDKKQEISSQRGGEHDK